MKRGAFDFVVKPWDNEKLIEILKAAYANLSKEAREASTASASSIKMHWGKGPAMTAIRRTVEKISLTDAHADHVGKFEQANGGTLFLDEIGNIPLHLQAKLLRAIQNRSIVRVGGTEAIPIDIRLICATNKNLEQMVKDGDFREDLYYRINTMHLHLPALRERTDEIVPLAEMFIEKYAEEKAIRAAMDRSGGNLSMVAKLLNISRPTLYAKLKK